MNTLKSLLAATTLLSSAAVAYGGTLHLSKSQILSAEGAARLHQGLPVTQFPGPGATAPPAGTYTFTLDGFRVTNTRALLQDTDYASIAVSVGGNAPIMVPAKAMGGINNGVYPVGLSIPNITVQPGQAVSVSYAIVNSGFNQNTLEQDLIKWIGSAAQKAAGAGAAALAGLLTSDPTATSIANTAGEQAGGWAANKLLNIIFADCDGTVAAGDHVFSGLQLANDTAGGHTMWSQDNNPGTDSPVGCGSNSQYYVTWSVHPSNVPETVPPLGPSGGGGSGGLGGGSGLRRLN